MKVLFAPWRKKYVKGASKPKQPKECVFCKDINSKSDQENFVLARYKTCFAVLNLYPYSCGHLMIIPHRHVAELTSLTEEELVELIKITTAATKIIKESLGAHGINVGMNIGEYSGAGIPDHLHMHALPRWSGDTGFLCSIFDTKVASVDLNIIYEKLKPQFEVLKP